jgi:hypothetical protein
VGANPRIVGFLSGERPDDTGRYLRDILDWSDDRLESVHDFIQWMFPLPEPSPVNPSAPVLDKDTVAVIRASTELQHALRRSWLRMLRFYGLQAVGERVERAKTFDPKSVEWLHRGNHNHLRITRILKCLQLCGLEREAQAFFECLTGLYEQGRGRTITDTTFRFWKDAVS